MNARNCRKCGKLFNYVSGPPICMACREALEKKFQEVKEYIRALFKRVFEEWGFDMVKLDFLYSAAIYPRNGKSRGQLMCEAMDFLRECCGEKLFLGCGVPLAPAFGLAHMNAAQWALALLAPLSVVPVAELYKFAVRRASRRFWGLDLSRRKRYNKSVKHNRAAKSARSGR